MNNIKKFEVNDNDVFKLLNHGKRTKGIAENALKNVIIPFPGFDATPFDENIWNVTKKEKYGNSYILYIHTLRVCADLLLHFEKTEEVAYFNKAEEIINSWIEYSRSENVHDMVWYDHTTANRTQVLIHFLNIALKMKKDVNYELYYGLLMTHAKVMMNDKIYNYNNHGLMMDRSLMILGNILNDEMLTLKGKYRAINTFWYSFSSQGIHLENSPQYHNMVVRMYMDIEKYLNKRHDTLGEHVIEYLKLARKYPSYIVRPDKRLATIGDSGPEKQKQIKNYENLFDKEAGVSILQYEHPNPFFLTFVCGYSSRVHKHKDDLSITLNYNNEDFFVDPGKYSYTRDKTRKYITSRRAHSAFYMEQFDYSIKNENRFNRKVSLNNYYENEEFTLVSGYNNDFDGSSAKLIRSIIQFNEQPVFFIIDNLWTDRKHDLKLTQKFNLASDKSVEQGEDIKIMGEKTSLTLKQFNEISSFEIIQGDKDKPVAVNTTGFAQVEETKQLKFVNDTNKTNVFLTAIYDEQYIKNVNASIDDSTVKLNFNDMEYYIYI